MITLSSLREQVRQRADMQNSNFISDTELDGYINSSYKELYDIVVSRFEDYYTTSSLFTISAGNTEALPDDFYKVRGVDYNYGGSFYELRKWNFNDRNILDRPYNILSSRYIDYRRYRLIGNNVQIVPEDKATGDYRLWYIPFATDMVVGVLATLTTQDVTYTSALGLYEDGNGITIEFTSGGTAGAEVVTVAGQAISVQIEDGVSTSQNVVDAITGDVTASALVTAQVAGSDLQTQTVFGPTNLSGGIVQVDGQTFNGWEEYIVIDAAMKCLVKEESDVSVLFGQKQALLDRIEKMASNRDAGEPEKVTDINRFTDDWDTWGGY